MSDPVEITFAAYGTTFAVTKEDLEQLRQGPSLYQLALDRALEDWDRHVEREMYHALVVWPQVREEMIRRHVQLREEIEAELVRRRDAGHRYTAREIDELVAKLQARAPWPPEVPGTYASRAPKLEPTLSPWFYRADRRP